MVGSDCCFEGGGVACWGITGFGGMTFVIDCECFEGIVFAEGVDVWAGFKGVKFAVGTCLGV